MKLRNDLSHDASSRNLGTDNVNRVFSDDDIFIIGFIDLDNWRSVLIFALNEQLFTVVLYTDHGCSFNGLCPVVEHDRFIIRNRVFANMLQALSTGHRVFLSATIRHYYTLNLAEPLNAFVRQTHLKV